MPLNEKEIELIRAYASSANGQAKNYYNQALGYAKSGNYVSARLAFNMARNIEFTNYSL